MANNEAVKQAQADLKYRMASDAFAHATSITELAMRGVYVPSQTRSEIIEQWFGVAERVMAHMK